MKAECIDYRQLPGQNPLFLEYLYQYDRVSSLYSCPVHLNPERLKSRADSVLRNPPPYPRDQLVQLLTEFNRRVGAGEQVFRNLEKLKSPMTLAVVTGHQLGFFGGPAFAVYKAITAVRLAQILEEEGYSAVPVFWLASDDSDFQEVRSASFFSNEGALFSVSYPGPRKNDARMVGTVSLGAVGECLHRLEKRGPEGEFHAQVLKMLQETYTRTRSFQEGLGSWLAYLFGSHGLILFDALLSGYRSAVPSLFAVAIEKRRAIVEALQERAEMLKEKGFHPQVRVEDSESLIFWMAGQKRYKLEYAEEGYSNKRRQSLKFSQRQLLNELDSGVENLGPNVLLRPILQDHLLPTVVYVGGPSEVAYFAQVNAISPFWNMEMAVFPRVGITVVDRKAQRLLKKYELQVSDVLNLTPEEVIQNVVQKTESTQIVHRFDRLQGDLESDLESLRADLGRTDPTVAGMLEGAQRKILYQMEKVQKRFVANHWNRRADFGHHLDYLYSRLYPNAKLQERVINFNQFLGEEGPHFIERLMGVVNPFCASHQVIYL